jgi:uncharacterized protein (TIGR02996 family)
MASEQELLQAVLENPGEDGPRLAYAEWCAMQPGEAERARAELIRSQIAIFHMPLDAFQDSEVVMRQLRVFELLNRYGSTWAGQVRELAADYQFERGFVELVRMSAGGFLSRAAELFSLAPVQHLDLTDVREVSEELFFSQYLGRLHSLGMDRCGLYDIHLHVLAASPQAAELRWLSVAENHLQLDGVVALARSEHLRNLRFAEFLGNPFNPTERQGWDSGVLVASWLPEDGKALESQFGYLPWLHRSEDLGRFK